MLMKKLFRGIFVGEEISWHVKFISDLSRILKPDNYAELGIYQGETFLKVYASHKFAIDISEYALTFIPSQENITKVCGTSESLAKLLDVKNMTLDLLFTDANHDYREVINDFSNLLPYLSKKAVVLFHDTYPKTIEFSDPKYCGDAYLSIEILAKQNIDWAFTTLPVHPGLSIASRIPLYPDWVH
jgi:hypothetical protein